MSAHDHTKSAGHRLNRRQFLSAALAVAGGGAAVGAWAADGGAITPAVATPPTDGKTPSQGYRQTEHTHAYYRAARF